MAYVIEMDVHDGQTTDILNDSECLTIESAQRSIDELVSNCDYDRESLHIVEDNDPRTIAAAKKHAKAGF
jgi:hypothetical protein